jgi:hypothetical protein
MRPKAVQRYRGAFVSLTSVLGERDPDHGEQRGGGARRRVCGRLPAIPFNMRITITP